MQQILLLRNYFLQIWKVKSQSFDLIEQVGINIQGQEIYPTNEHSSI